MRGIGFSSCGYLGASVLAAALTGSAVMADVKSGISLLEAGKVQEAVKAFQAGFDAGDADGAFYLGRLFELGLGTDKDITRASQLYALAAGKGSALGQNRLGLMFLQGEGVLKDYARGAELICEAAEAGDANAQFNCGTAYRDGTGVLPDAAKALSYWEKAADQGHIASLNFAAEAYAKGLGTTPDLGKARMLFEQTANQGNAMGLFELAKLDASAAEPNLKQAYVFANLAASRAHPEAAALRDQLETRMPAAEVLAAQAEARAWKATPPGGTSSDG